jgi:hypothetical protein
MAGNIQGDNSGNILVEFDYNNIIIVDPNKTIDAFGNIKERLVDHEKLVMFANLEAEVLPRTKLEVGAAPTDRIRTISVAKINFLRPTEGTALTDGYYDELTGKNARNMLGQNQIAEEIISPNDGTKPYVKTTVNNPGQIATDNGLLGITNITVRTNTSFIPSVTMKLEDVQGRALFQLGNNSPYSAFFNLPYCPFYLTLKGYYGQAIKYQLNLTKFNARFNTYSGNYQIDLEFVGYKFNILNEISMAHLLAAPHMYSTRFDISKSVTSPETSNTRIPQTAVNAASKNSTISKDNVVEQIVTEKGYQKVLEVYSEYKAKNLIAPDFPELTFAQLLNKLETFEQDIIQSYTKVDVEPLTNIRAYKQALTQYYGNVISNKDSWFNTYLNPKPIVLNNNGGNVYTFKKEILDDISERSKVKSFLSAITTTSNTILANNKTLGVGADAEIKNSINYDTMIKSVNLVDIDIVETAKQQYNISTVTDEDKIKVTAYLSRVLSASLVKDPFDTKITLGDITIPPLFIFEGDSKINGQVPRFKNLIAQMDAQANQKLSEAESAITAEFAAKIQDSATGIGFKPTVRNVCAVIMASTEAFIRLLDEVHTNAWNVKYDPVRKSAILDNQSSAKGTDTLGHVNVDPQALSNNSPFANAQQPVYPWPQYFVETPEDKKGRFQLKYIADPTEVDRTKGFNYESWPEVEFVEEYMKGLTEKFNPPVAQVPTDVESTTNIVNINAIEYPSSGIAYQNKEELKFFYEIWERQFLTANYNGFTRANQNQLDELVKMITSAETNNIITSVGVSSPFLTFKLKNYPITAENYPQTLENFSNGGTGKSYQEYIRDFFVTPYIRTYTESSFNILSLNDIGKAPKNRARIEALKQLVSNASNDPTIVDTYPFTNSTWVKNNMANSTSGAAGEVYNTKKVLTVFEPRNMISNFESIYVYTKNRPVTNFCYLNVSNPVSQIKLTGLQEFYVTRKNPSNFIPTEGYVSFASPSNPSRTISTTSMLNTPYFVNAIQNGVSNWRKSDKYPYTQAAYLLINSLPLATLREKYKSNNQVVVDNNQTTINQLVQTATQLNINYSDLDYIASCFKKFGAIHKIPYAWILKIGSIWYRYKTYKNSGVDILDSAWKNFDYKTNFDPITSSDTKTYSFLFEGEKNITLQNVGTDVTKIQNGFYPKLINDFNTFYNGFDLYSKYTNEEIQASIFGGLKIYNFADSNISSTSGAVLPPLNIPLNIPNIQTWSVILPDGAGVLTNADACTPNNNTTSTSYYIVPSFGSGINQLKTECFINGTLPVCNFVDNNSMYNGTVRMLWEAPNYGYFDNSKIVKPSPDAYLNKIVSGGTQQAAFKMMMDGDYSKIEELFSVFEKSILDRFEQEFLNFSKPLVDIDLGPQVVVPVGVSPGDSNAMFKNFQYLMQNLMKVNAKPTNSTTSDYFNTLGQTQLTNFNGVIKTFMEYDVIFKYGNPASYRRRIFDSFIFQEDGTNPIVEPIVFEPYVKNTLPSLKGTITLAQSRAAFPLEWTTLETEVGFSTIPELIYTSKGSYITDFFIDNNIGFTVDNIVLLAPIIKMYATQKLYQPSITSKQFATYIQTYLNENSSFQNIILNAILTEVRKKLPDQQQLPEKTIYSVTDGQQGKVETYEVFKALNDKWIAGGDYTNKTLFEDILFLDRASRNIGDIIIVDIFDLKNITKKNSLNLDMSVFTFMSGLLIKNKFNVMPLPAYVNFWGVQNVDGTTIAQNNEGSLKFADNMWGTFLSVDYRESTPKMVCFYAGQPSTHLDLPKGNSRYRDDGFELRRASDNPLLENTVGKTDYALSNKVVGFNVDIGIRNQNIFYSFDVGMESGKATSETIQTTINMVDQASGRNVATQNNSLWNLYKQRSYTCKATCLGNALLQPTMYFNLRHVPLFYGPYFITEVNHTITPGTFQTEFTGVRQQIYDLPTVDNYLQSINQNVLSKIEEVVKNSKDPVDVTPTTNLDKAALLQQSGLSTASAQNSCTNALKAPYLSWGNWVQSLTTSLTPDQFVTEMKNAGITDVEIQVLIFVICYISNYRDKKYYGYNNNYANITLTTDFGPSGDNFIQKQSSCVNINNSKDSTTSKPIANFESVTKFMKFMETRLKARKTQILNDIGIQKYYACYWPTQQDKATVDYYEKHYPLGYEKLNESVKKALALANAVKLPVDVTGKITVVEQKEAKKIEQKKTTTPAKPNNLNTTTTTGFVCPPPTITSFTPNIGVNGTILSIVGTNLTNTVELVINNVSTVTGITINSDTSLTVIVPYSNAADAQNNPITVKTKYGNVISSFTTATNFTYDPQQLLPGISNSNTNTQPQQTGSQPAILVESGTNFLVRTNTLNWIISEEVEYVTSISSRIYGYLYETNNLTKVQLINNVNPYVHNNLPPLQRNFEINQEQFLNNVLNLNPYQKARTKDADVYVTWKIKLIWADKFNNVPNPTNQAYPADVVIPFQWSFVSSI